MPLLQVIVLGIVQGLTEFLPISSSAHLALLGSLGPVLFGWPDQGLAFDIALHAGTLAAIIVFFFRDWVQVLAQGFGLRVNGDPALQRNRWLLWFMALGTIPLGLAGLLFQERAENAWRHNYYMIGTMLIAIGLVMWLAERAGRRQKDLGHLTLADTMTVGLAQALSVVPGVSRSGVTISAGLFRNLDRATAARFSFLLSTPAILAAAAKDAWDLFRHEGGLPQEMRAAFGIGMLVSGVVGAITIKFFLDFLRRRSLAFFVYYRVIFGIIVIALAVFRK
jgi:undecaprenyl-diphosphatase